MMKKFYCIILIMMLGVSVPNAQETQNRSILVFGDSITAGYGVDADSAFPAIIQNKIDSLGWDFNVINGGVSGETSAGGLRRIEWRLRSKPAVFILELGGNDGLRGVDLESTKRNLQAIIDKVENRYPDTIIMIAGMQVPPNLGTDYTKRFKEIYPDLAEKNEAIYIPFILEGVGGRKNFMQNDGIHPNERGHKRVAENIWDVLKPVLDKIR